jgi:hypothetical protein
MTQSNDVTSVSRELRRWVFQNRRELRPAIESDQLDLPNAWADMVALMEKRGAPSELRSEARAIGEQLKAIGEQLNQSSRSFNMPSSKSLAEHVKTASSREDALTIIENYANDSDSVESDSAAALRGVSDDLTPEQQERTFVTACLFCGALAWEGGPVAVVAACLLCGLFAD